jgi:hypothetical protein
MKNDRLRTSKRNGKGVVRMNHPFVRNTIGLLGLAFVILSWVLTQPVLWSQPALSGMYGLYGFALTSLGWTVVIVIFVVGFIMTLYGLLSRVPRIG